MDILASEGLGTRLRVASLEEAAADPNSADLTWLSPDEWSYFQAINSASRKAQYLAGHYLIRKVASQWFGNSPHDWNYHRALSNIRLLKSVTSDIPQLNVSITHSGKWLAVAVSTAPVGIDIECFGKSRNLMSIARHMFSDAEIKRLEICDPLEFEHCFYLYWTLKESAAKQYGEGLRRSVTRLNSPVGYVEGGVVPEHILRTWLCPDYVLAVSGIGAEPINILGLQQPARYQTWRNQAA